MNVPATIPSTLQQKILQFFNQNGEVGSMDIPKKVGNGGVHLWRNLRSLTARGCLSERVIEQSRYYTITEKGRRLLVLLEEIDKILTEF